MSSQKKSNACKDEVRSLRRCMKLYSDCVKNGGKVSQCLKTEGSPSDCEVRNVFFFKHNTYRHTHTHTHTTEIC